MDLLIGLGGNVGDVPGVFAAACRRLSDEVTLLGSSRIYRTRAVGPEQPRYWNMAVLVAAARPLLAVLALCQQLEAATGRDRSTEQRWGPRALDLDLLMAPAVVRRGPRLTLPHPRFHERAFALVPAAELCPEWLHPVLGRTLAELADEALAAAPEAVEQAGALQL